MKKLGTNRSSFLIIAIIFLVMSNALPTTTTVMVRDTEQDKRRHNIKPIGDSESHKVEEIYIEGSKTGIMMLHGFSASSLTFKPLATALSLKGYTVYCPLLSGHGQEISDLEDVKKETYYKCVDEKLAEFSKKVDRVYVFGHSLGSLLATRLAARNDLEGIILMSAPFIPLTPELDLDDIQHAMAVVENIEPRLPRLNPRYLTDTDFLDKYGIYPEFSIKGMAVTLDIIRDARKDLAEVDEPVLVIHGTYDPVADSRGAEFIIDHVRSDIKQVVYIQSMSHRFYLGEKMAQVLKATCDFIEKVEKQEEKAVGDN